MVSRLNIALSFTSCYIYLSQVILSKSDILEEVLNGHCSDEILRDVCDGKFVQTHPMFSQDQQTLLLALYYDDVEVVNPLGSRRGIHKLG